jgi:hypothetical protein
MFLCGADIPVRGFRLARTFVSAALPVWRGYSCPRHCRCGADIPVRGFAGVARIFLSAAFVWRGYSCPPHCRCGADIPVRGFAGVARTLSPALLIRAYPRQPRPLFCLLIK